MMPASGWEAFAGGAARALDEAAQGEFVLATWDGAGLVCASGAALDLAGGETWDPRPSLAGLASGSGQMMWSAVAERLQDMLLAAHAATGTDQGILGDGTIARAFAARLRSTRFPACIVGFGPGTTPSGDDWIAGYLCAVDTVSGSPGQTVPKFRAAIRQALDGTTAAGRSLLLGAIAGAAPAYLVRLALDAAALARAAGGDSGQATSEAEALVAAALYAALHHGATSGEDALSGFVAGLREPRPYPLLPLAPEWYTL